jgi:hypothetical protein
MQLPCHQGAVHVDGRLLEEGVGLSGPNLDPRVIEEVEQGMHVGRGEASAEVARGGRVGDTASAQGVEEDFVVAAQLDVLQTGAVAHGVVSEIEDVVRFVKGHVDLEQVQATVDRIDQADLAGQGVQGADAAVGHAPAALRELIMHVAGGELRFAARAELGFVQAPLDPPLAAPPLFAYLGVHSKSLLAAGKEKRRISLRPRKTPRDFEFFKNYFHQPAAASLG